jgi:hypothetical protein
MTADLVHLPSHRALGLGADTLNVDTARDRLQALGEVDPEYGHALADQLMVAGLQLIADGHGNPAKVAADTLAICAVEFPRWTA